MKIATYNINDVNKRIANLLDWLKSVRPDVACLQELKATDSAFPVAAIEKAGYGAVWRGQKSWNGVAILARGCEPVITRTTLPGDDSDTQSRYIEAAVNGVLIGTLYAPNGNPQPGPKFKYKLAWMKRLLAHADELYVLDAPVVLAGDYNVVPTDADIFSSKSYAKNALVQPEPRALFRRILDQGWIDAIRTMHPDAPMYTFWDYMRNRWQRDAGLRIDHLLLNPKAAKRLVDAGIDRDVRGGENVDLIAEFVAACGFQNAKAPGYEADDFLASAAHAEEKRGGTVLIASGDRDTFQLASACTTILYPGRAGEMARVDPADVRARYGVDPDQVPDFIALRGDPSDKLPGASGVGATGAATLLQRYGTLEAALAAGRFPTQAKDLRLFRSIATMNPKAALPSLRNQKPTWGKAAALARKWELNQLARRLEELANG